MGERYAGHIEQTQPNVNSISSDAGPGENTPGGQNSPFEGMDGGGLLETCGPESGMARTEAAHTWAEPCDEAQVDRAQVHLDNSHVDDSSSKNGLQCKASSKGKASVIPPKDDFQDSRNRSLRKRSKSCPLVLVAPWTKNFVSQNVLYGKKKGAKAGSSVKGTVSNKGMSSNLKNYTNPLQDDNISNEKVDSTISNSITDSNVRQVNHRIISKDKRTAERIWDIGKRIGATSKVSDSVVVDKIMEVGAREKSGYERMRSREQMGES